MAMGSIVIGEESERESEGEDKESGMQHAEAGNEGFKRGFLWENLWKCWLNGDGLVPKVKTISTNEGLTS